MTRSEQGYRRVLGGVVEMIRTGAYPAGTNLPTVAEMAAEHDVSTATIARVMGMLNAFGLVVGRPGSGSRVATEPVRSEALELINRAAELERRNRQR
jgi:GntR family transcriptional regulator